MELLQIRKEGDPILRMIAEPVEVFDGALIQLLENMAYTMEEAEGVGLAAPQVGVRKRICVIDVGEGLIELINPRITVKAGKQREIEGCLSCPQQYGVTERPMKVTVKAQNRHGRYFNITGTGLLARAFCHEIDHLDGILFIDHAIQMVDEE